MAETRELAISLPEPVVKSAAALAAKENRSVSDLVQELIARHESVVAWRELKSYGLGRGKASGYTENDVIRLVSETREELAPDRHHD